MLTIRRAGDSEGGRPATRSRHNSRVSRMVRRAVGWSGSLVAWPGGCKSEQFRDRLVAVVFRGLSRTSPAPVNAFSSTGSGTLTTPTRERIPSPSRGCCSTRWWWR
ncbi:hypothetical protein [Parafrankia soli]|uniref:hypothetical protein n=1 Tax=Parafrankia soli TaxID=2599596 RepID=UPI001F51DE0F|nr:hypothetical protein [Parafrankia soli]